MFALLIAGRPIVGDFKTISPTQFAFQVPSSPPFSHLAVFMLPGTDFPLDQAAAVYIQLTPTSEFRLLGAIAANKQSAIFRVRDGSGSGAAATAVGGVDEDAMVDDTTDRNASAGNVITIGISVEPAAQVEAALAAQKASAASSGSMALVKTGPPPASSGLAGSSSVTTKVLAKRIIQNAFNFLSSFGSDNIPLKAFQDWWTKFERKVDLDPGFLEREQG
jgi:hypothetical protein